MKNFIKTDWNEILEEEINKAYYKDLRKLLVEEYKNYVIYPKAEDIYNAFNLTPYKDVKVVILGQDPYHGEGQAHGLSFSVKNGVAIPPSLRNIYKELNSDIGIEIPKSGDLSKWAKEGVLLLNTTLTVRKASPMSHSKIGWEILTGEVIKSLNKKDRPVVFMLWGNHARSKKGLITNEKHLIIESAHPSPLSASRGFLGSKPFSRCNKFLRDNNIEPPTWQL